MAYMSDPSKVDSSDLPLKDPVVDEKANFVLESRGGWTQAAYHLITSICATGFLSLPFAMALMGWYGGTIALVIGMFVTFYGYVLFSEVLEECEKRGHRYLRYRELCSELLHPIVGEFLVHVSQQAVCFGAVVGSTILGGTALQFIYRIYHTDITTGPELYVWIIVFGACLLILCEMPSFHSLWFFNLLGFLCCIGYTITIFAGIIIAGHNTGNPSYLNPSYSVVGSGVDKMWGIFVGLSIFATAYGNSVIPEIQATLKPPIENKMVKALYACYAVALVTFFPICFAGYWAFGNLSNGNPFFNLAPPGESSLIPNWLLFLACFFVITQLLFVALIYSQPMFDLSERWLLDGTMSQWSTRNLIPRLIFRTLYISLGVFIAALFPFFGDINAVVGSLGYTPLDFVLPPVLHLVVFKRPRDIYWLLKWVIIVAYTIIGILGLAGSIRQIKVDSVNYKLFANL